MGDEPEIESEIIKCWCGAEGTYDELFDDSCNSDSCGGTGTINCECGGDFCVCHHHGEHECYGCHECDADSGEDHDYEHEWGEQD